VSAAKDPWIAASDVVPMFPTLVWKLKLARESHEALEERILGMFLHIGYDALEIRAACCCSFPPTCSTRWTRTRAPKRA